MKRIRILACILAVLLLLTGCRTKPAPTETTPAPTTVTVPSTAQEDLAEIVVQQLPAKLENPDNLPVLKWVCMVDDIWGGGDRTWNEAAVVELNEMLARKGAGYRVQFTMLTSPKMEYSEWFRRQEALDALQDADLIYGLMTVDQMKQYLSPITQYIDGTESTALVGLGIHSLSWVNGTVDGEIYGISTRPAHMYCDGWKVDPAVFEEFGLTEADFSKPYWEMQDVFAKIYAAKGNKPFLHRSGSRLISSMPLSGTGTESFQPGELGTLLGNLLDFQGSVAALDYSSGTPKVVNYLETEAFRRVLEAHREYVKLGYCALSQGNAQPVTFTDNCMLDRPYTDAEGYRVIPCGSVVLNTVGEKHVTGISASAKHAREAVELLALIAADEEFRMQLFYGKEGRDYTVKNGSYVLTKQEDKSNYSMDFLFEIAYFSGMSSYDPPCYKSPSTLNYLYWLAYEGETVLQTQQAMTENCDVWCPVNFNYTGLEAELQAVKALAKEKLPGVTEMDDEAYRKFLEELNQAGLEKIISELQRQLDAWLTDNPDWNK